MSLISAYGVATDPNFINRVRMAIIDGAITIVNANANPERVEFAKMVLRDSQFWAIHFAFAAAADDATTNSSTDAQLKTRLAAVFPTFVSVT